MSMTQQAVPSDDKLVAQAQQGKLEAFTMLYERYLPVVYNRVRYVVPDSDVEDVTQEVFITVLKSLNSFKGQAQFTTWLRTLTNRRVADYYRQRNDSETHLKVDLSEVNPGSIAGLQISSQVGESDDKIILRQAIRSLPDHYQEVLLLRFAEGLKFKEIAQLQDQSLEATKSLFRRAIAALRSELGETYAAEYRSIKQ